MLPGCDRDLPAGVAPVRSGAVTADPASVGFRRPAAETAGPAVTGYRAVQGDIAVTVVDWPVVHAWREGDPDFVGAVTVIDDGGAQVLTVDWSAPTDAAADQALTRAGWARVGPWAAGLRGPPLRAGDPGPGPDGPSRARVDDRQHRRRCRPGWARIGRLPGGRAADNENVPRWVRGCSLSVVSEVAGLARQRVSWF